MRLFDVVIVFSRMGGFQGRIVDGKIGELSRLLLANHEESGVKQISVKQFANTNRRQ